MAKSKVQRPKPVVDADVHGDAPFKVVAEDVDHILIAHEIKGMGCIVMRGDGMVFIPQTVIMTRPDGTYKLGRR